MMTPPAFPLASQSSVEAPATTTLKAVVPPAPEVPVFSSIEVLAAEVKAAKMRLAAATPPAPTSENSRVAEVRSIARHAARALVVLSLAFVALSPVVRFLVRAVAGD